MASEIQSEAVHYDRQVLNIRDDLHNSRRRSLVGAKAYGRSEGRGLQTSQVVRMSRPLARSALACHFL